MNVLYLDLVNSGISGDLFLGALLGLMDNPDKILDELEDLKNILSGIKKLKINLRKQEISGIMVNKMEISLEEKKNHRNSKDLKNALKKYLNEKDFSETSKEYANAVLNSLIKAEAKVHNELEDKIHLHELSSVDTLIDILGVTQALEFLGFFKEDLRIYTSMAPLGSGRIKAAHGELPIPAPATSKIIERFNLVVQPGPVYGELTTPTGAALLGNLNAKFSFPKIIVKKDAYSTGQKTFKDFPNIFRLFLGRLQSESENNYHLSQYNETISIIETNIDDISGEIVGDFFELMEDKVLDIQVIQGLTKKNRPSHIVKILCHPKEKYDIIRTVLENLGTLGVRYYDINRICIEREIRTIRFELDGESYSINYKVSYIREKNQKKIINIKPEYEDLKKLRKKTNYSIQRLQAIILPRIYQDISKEDNYSIKYKLKEIE